MFKAVRPECGGLTTRTRLRDATARQARIINGGEREALEFARRACEFLRPKGVEAVEAWLVQIENEKSRASLMGCS